MSYFQRISALGQVGVRCSQERRRNKCESLVLLAGGDHPAPGGALTNGLPFGGRRTRLVAMGILHVYGCVYG